MIVHFSKYCILLKTFYFVFIITSMFLIALKSLIINHYLLEWKRVGLRIFKIICKKVEICFFFFFFRFLGIQIFLGTHKYIFLVFSQKDSPFPWHFQTRTFLLEVPWLIALVTNNRSLLSFVLLIILGGRSYMSTFEWCTLLSPPRGVDLSWDQW